MELIASHGSVTPDITYSFKSVDKAQILPIFGLYLNYNNDVTLIYTDQEGNERARSEVKIQTMDLVHPYKPSSITVFKQNIEEMELGMTLVNSPGQDETFCMTYGDGVCDVDISEIIKFHRSHGKLATLTSVLLDQSKGVLNIGGDNAVQSFREKSKEDSAPINAGYMVLEPEIFDYLDGDECIFEQAPLEKLAEEGQLMSYCHRGFWQCMDTMREKIQLENLWTHGKAPWKVSFSFRFISNSMSFQILVVQILVFLSRLMRGLFSIWSRLVWKAVSAARIFR